METLDYIKSVDTSKCNIVPQKSERYGVGSLIQLQALGPQDEVIYESESDFLFTAKYDTHTPINPIQENIEFSKKPKFGDIFNFSFPLKKTLMIKNLYLHVQLPALNQSQSSSSFVHWVNKIGYRLIKNAKFSIDNEIVSEYSGMYLYYNSIIHNTKHKFKNELMGVYESDELIDGNSKELYIELPILFSHYFPIPSIHNSSLNIEITFENINNLIVSDGDFNSVNVNLVQTRQRLKSLLSVTQANVTSVNLNNIKEIDCKFAVDYINIIDENEIKKFIHDELSFIFNGVEYQRLEITGNNQSFDLHFNNAIKDIILVFENNIFNWYLKTMMVI